MFNKRVLLKAFILTLFTTFLVPAIQAESCLWKITSTKGTIYIQGSVHTLKAENYPLAPAIEKAYSNSSALVLEVDMGEMMSPTTQQLILEKAILQQPNTLKNLLTPSTYERLEAVANESGLPMAAIQQFKPWFATMTLTLLQMQKMGLSDQYGLDKYFYEKAKADKKKVVGLESVDFQIALFDSLIGKDPNDFVNRSLTDLKLLESDVSKLLEAWEKGDIQALEVLLSKSFDDYPDLYNKFITARNKAWTQQLVDMMRKEQTYMVVVGAGHLPGKEGIINLLKNNGCSVEQL